MLVAHKSGGCVRGTGVNIVEDAPEVFVDQLNLKFSSQTAQSTPPPPRNPISHLNGKVSSRQDGSGANHVRLRCVGSTFPAVDEPGETNISILKGGGILHHVQALRHFTPHNRAGKVKSI